MNTRTLACSLLLTAALAKAYAQPVITNQPTDQSVSLGASTKFQISATSASPPIRYQWRHALTNLDGRTNSTLTLTNIQVINAGDYDAMLTDGSGSITSRVAHLEVDPTFTKITTGEIVNDGGASFRCAWGDYDNDGFLDLFVTNFGGGGQKNFLYHNNRNGTFARVIAGPIANDIGDWGGGAWADFDNDGNLDLLAVRGDNNAAQAVLYRNNGDGTFTRLPAKTIGGVVPAGGGAPYGPVWADYDNDGVLDVFVARSGIDWLYHNDGNGGFTSITNNLLGTATEDSFDAAWADYNNDGRPDLFVAMASDPATNRLYLNLGGGSFAQVTSGSIVTDSAGSVGCAWGDYDNDGNLDLFLVNGLSPGQNNFLYHNNGGGTFTRMTSDVVGSIASDPAVFAGCAWGDYDNDGFIDLFVTHGEVGVSPGINYLYHNNGNGSFTRILTGSLVNDDTGNSVGCAWGDYDNDGFLDLFLARRGEGGSITNGLYRNNGNSNGWLKLKLVGTVSNGSAIGTKVRVKATIGGKALWQLREINTGSALNQNPLEAHFGLSNATNIDIVRIEWPSGIVQTITNVVPRQFLTIVEHQEKAAGTIGLAVVERLTNGAIRLSASSSSNVSLLVLFEASTNLISWTRLGSRTNLNGTVEFLDSGATNLDRRFYRASIP